MNETPNEVKAALDSVEKASRKKGKVLPFPTGSPESPEVIPSVVAPPVAITPAPPAIEVKLTSTQRIGYQSILDKITAFQNAQLEFLKESLKEQGWNPDDSKIKFVFNSEKLTFSVSENAGV